MAKAEFNTAAKGSRATVDDGFPYYPPLLSPRGSPLKQAYLRIARPTEGYLRSFRGG